MILNELNHLSTKTYSYFKGGADNYLIDIVTDLDEDTYNAYIYATNYAQKLYMFGMPTDQQSYEDFLEIVDANLEEYIEDYWDMIETLEADDLETMDEAGNPVMDCDRCPDFFTCDNMGWFNNCPKHKGGKDNE